MSDSQKAATPPRPAQGSAERKAAAPTTQATTTAAMPIRALASDLGDAGKKALDVAVFGKRPYLRAAFFNPYNLSLLGGGIAASLLTVNPFIAIATLGMEAIWLLNAPDSERLRHLLWDPRFEKLRKSIEASERARRMEGLPEDVRERVDGLVGRREQIQKLAEANPSFTGELLRGELVKTDTLVNAFLDMALTCQRYMEYLTSVDPRELERDQQRYTVLAQKEGPEGEIAKKNLAIVKKRAEKVDEIRHYVSVARGQLDLIENSFQLIADQIVTMQSPQELSGQLDELLDGVEAIRETSRDTEKLLGTIERAM